MQCSDGLVAAVRRTTQAVLLVVAGAAILRVSLFGDVVQRYVQPGLQPYLIASGGFLILLGLFGVLLRDRVRPRPAREGAEEDDTGQMHNHLRGPRVAWLLLPPTLLLLFLPPPALGSYSAARANPLLVGPWGHFDALPTTNPVPLSLTEYIGRVQQDKHQSLVGRTVALEGFVTHGKSGSWQLNRLIVWCCAADAQSLAVRVYGADAPPANAWVQLTGTWHKSGVFGTATAGLAIDAKSVTRVHEPERPYQDKAPNTI
jgi:uncharacterized repeat protein (TIGR03943 family)